MASLRPIQMECMQYSQSHASAFRCKRVRWDWSPDSELMAMCFFCEDKKKRDAFICKVRLHNYLNILSVIPDPDPRLSFPFKHMAANHWRVTFQIKPEHPFFRSEQLPPDL